MSPTEGKVRNTLTDPRFWILIAYIGLTFVVVGLYYVNGRTSHSQVKIAKDEAIHESEIQSNAQAAVISCLGSIATLKQANDLTKGVRIFHQAMANFINDLVQNTNESDKLYKIRKDNLKKIEETIPLVSRLHFKVPTKAECKARGAHKK